MHVRECNKLDYKLSMDENVNIGKLKYVFAATTVAIEGLKTSLNKCILSIKYGFCI